MENIKELVQKIYKDKEEVEALENQKADIESDIKKYNTEIEEFNKQLLEAMKTENLNEVVFDSENLVAVREKRETAQMDETKVIAWLKSNFDGKFIKVKESLDKNPLKKELKENASLKESLDPMMTGVTVTEYVVVTDKENFELRRQRIEENLKKKGN